MSVADVERQPRSAVETRSGDAYEVASVNFDKRLITVLAMPYETPTLVQYRGRWVNEVVSRSAFDGVERRAGQVKVNRDHTWDKPVGKVVALHPSRSEGLVAEIKITKGTPSAPYVLGDDTLALADDGVLSASVGFMLLARNDGRVYDDAEVWEQRGALRRLNRLRLDHIALVPMPAYADAVVLDVRDSTASVGEAAAALLTPNLDRLAAIQARQRFEELDRKYRA